MSIHIGAEPGQVAPTLLMPGDPLRAKYFAETLLEDVSCFNQVRGMLGFTGTYNGKRVSVMGSGMGIPTLGIYVHELINEYGVELREFNDDVYEAFGEAATEVIEETRDHSALAAEIIDSFLDARNNVGVWTNYSDAPYVAKRNRFLRI